MKKHTEITGTSIDLLTLFEIAAPGSTVSLSSEVLAVIQRSRAFLERSTKELGKTWYGVNTGFGSLYHVRISDDATDQLQLNLIRSHAAGTGPLVPREISRLTLLLKILSFCPGNSGVRPELMNQLIRLFNAGVTPAMYQFGSLGASGDLAPLAHLALVVVGEGECILEDGSVAPAAEILKQYNIKPLALKSKEGLALINGTQFSGAYGAWAVQRAWQLLDLAQICGALSFDAFNGNPQPLDARIHAIRPHAGQIEVARTMRKLLEGSEIAVSGEKQLQDPYAFRCVPQVHGATWNAVQHCHMILITEINSVTDNPLIFPDEEEVLSGGNFHGQPIALVMDYLALALAELGSISERRTYQLLCGTRGLPDYLTLEAGVQSGLMIAQYTAASIVNRNKTLCAPASIDSIPTSKGQEDHVSMSANAASKLYELCDNLHAILAIEFLTATRALEFRKPAKTSPYLEDLRARFAAIIGDANGDQALYPLIQAAKEFTLDLRVPADQ
jgi:histidine ammonia-lyase